MGWRDFLEQPDLSGEEKIPSQISIPMEKKEKKEKTPSEIEKIPFIPFIPPGGDSESPDLTIIDHLAAPAKPVEGGIDFVSLLTEIERGHYLDLLEIMQSPKFGMDRETAEREAGAIVARNRHPLQIKQAAQDYRKNGYIKIYSTVLGQAIYLARDEEAVKRVPDQKIAVFLESDVEAVKGLTPDEAKVLLEARIIFIGPVKVEDHSATPCPQTMDGKQITRNFYGK